MATGGVALLEQLELALLRLVALARQVLQRLLAGHHLAAAYNAAVLVLDEVGLGEATGGVLRRSVKNLGLGSNGGHVVGHLILRTRVLIRRARFSDRRLRQQPPAEESV